MQSLPGNLYDDHPLKASLQQVQKLTGIAPKEAYVDRGYRGYGLAEPVKVWIACASCRFCVPVSGSVLISCWQAKYQALNWVTEKTGFSGTTNSFTDEISARVRIERVFCISWSIEPDSRMIYSMQPKCDATA